MGYQTVLMPMIVPQPVIPVVPVMIQDIRNYCTCDISIEGGMKDSNANQVDKSEYLHPK